jgi:uncharacterized membrane protein
MGARIASMALRLFFLLNLVLGLIFWFSDNDAIVPFHMLVGILFVISLWVYSALVGLQTGNVGLVAGSFVLGLLLAIIGMTQASILSSANSPHWIIQVIHLLLAFLAIGFAESVGGRAQRTLKARAA